MQVLRLTKFFCKNDLGHERNIFKNKKEVSCKFLPVQKKKPPEESGGLKYSHEKQKNVIQLKAK
jgi:hypothetical protein